MSQKEIIEKIKNNNKLTQREKVKGIIEHTEDVTIIFGLGFSDNRKVVMCNKCRADMNHIDVTIDEHTEFECRYCGKNIKVPLYIWNDDVYHFPNEHYTDAPEADIKAQSLAQAHRYLVEYVLK